jgi:RNAse H domain protein, YqgF family
VQAICKVVLEENVGEVVLGLPLNMDGSKGERAEKATAFYELLKKKLSCPLIFFDERLSTIEARAILDENAVPRNKQKEVLDQVAAQVILEDYLRTKGKL